MGRVRNGAAEEDWRWDLNPGVAAIEREDHVALKERREGHGVWGERRERITQLWRSEQKSTTQFRRREDHAVLEERERTTLFWQSGDPMVATQLMVLGP